MESKAVKCQMCDGRGYQLELVQRRCDHCTTSRNVSANVTSQPCRICDGRGIIYYPMRSIGSCSHCGGHGVIQSKILSY